MNDLQKNSLMSLIDNARNDHRSITKEVRRNLDLISEARGESVPWSKIAEALGFPGKLRQVHGAFSKQSKNRTKEKEVMPEKKKWTPAPKEEKKDVPGSDEPAPAGGGVRLIKGKEDFADLGDGVQRI